MNPLDGMAWEVAQIVALVCLALRPGRALARGSNGLLAVNFSVHCLPVCRSLFGILVVFIITIMWYHTLLESKQYVGRQAMLVENIQRQLMTENYDYMSSESEEMFPIKHELTDRVTDPSAEVSKRHDRAEIELDSEINDQFIVRANGLDLNDNFETDNSQSISANDLLYYVHDDRLKNAAAEKQVERDTSTTVPSTTKTRKVKYKVLKVRDPHSNRRSQSFRRFIQEEGEDGVAIINLNEEPFPEFRLPSARRQYMMEGAAGSSGVEVAPLSDEDDPILSRDRKMFDYLERTLAGPS